MHKNEKEVLIEKTTDEDSCTYAAHADLFSLRALP